MSAPLIMMDLRGYRLFVRISAALGGFMFTKRANRGAMRKSCAVIYSADAYNVKTHYPLLTP